MRTLFIFSLLFCLTSIARSQDSNAVKPATVYFLRSTGFGSLGAFNAFIDDSLVCKLNNDRYSVHLVRPGVHRMQVKVDAKKTSKKIQTLEILMEAGKSYYINMGITHYQVVYQLYLNEITVNSFNKLMPSLKEDTKCQ